MKFWELVSVTRETPDVMERVAAERPEWSEIADWRRTFAELVDREDRSVLDRDLPHDYVTAVLSAVGGVCYLGADGWLRSFRMHPLDAAVSFVDVYRRYGGEVLERVLESGATIVDPARLVP